MASSDMNFPQSPQIQRQCYLESPHFCAALQSLFRIFPYPVPMKTIAPFTAHPASVGETYAEHLVVAGSFGGRLLLAGLACLVHGLFPFLFVRTGSRTIADLHQRMTRR
jgi:hypothetical protein